MKQSLTGVLFLVVLASQSIFLTLSTIFSVDPSLSAFGTGWRRFGLLSQLAILLLTLGVAKQIAGAPQRMIFIFRAVAAAGVLTALYGTAQYLGWDPMLHADQVRFAGKFRPPGTFGNPTYFANYLLFPILVGLGIGLDRGPASWQCLGWAAVGTGSFALLLTGTRSAVAGLIAGVLVLGWRLRPRLNRKHASAFAVFAVLVSLFILSTVGVKLRDRLGQWIQDPVGGPRALIYRDTLRMARQHLFLGTGPDSFEVVFPPYQSPELARSYPDFYEESPHNVCLDYLTAQGLPGVLCFVALSGLGIIAAAKPRILSSAVVLACLVAALIAHQFTVFVLPAALLYFVFLGAAVGLSAEPVHLDGGRSDARSWMDSCLLPVAALLLVVASQWVYVEVRWRGVKAELEGGNVSAAVRDYQALQHIPPPVPGLDLWFSQQLAAWISKSKSTTPMSQEWEILSQAADRACRTSANRQNALYNLGLVGLLAHDAPGAEHAFDSAARQAPNWYKPHLLLAEILLQTGRPDAARIEALKAVDLSGGRHPETLRTLEATRARH
jgi:putative inorganic carbon (HCO3(-)) transporter